MDQSDSQKIQLLPEHIIDQIKAGEVIERPSTLLKELLENSIDAKSTKIDIEISSNGLDLISVRDNGQGIAFEDLDLAFCRHATSKIERFEDIYNLFTYGFRGEALASIASICKLTCVTNQKNSPEGTIKIYGGEVLTLDQDKEAQPDSGTSMFIRDLFYNTPARMKFIQSKTSEKNQLDKIVKAFLLTQPEVKISIKWDDQDKQVFEARGEDLKKRVEETIKKNRPLNLIELNSTYDQVDFTVFLSRESSRGNAGKSQFLFVNGRLVQDTAIHKIILNSAYSLWPQGETGNYCAYINLPSERVDVNIHPNKIQVKFFEAPKIYSLVSGAIKDGLAKRRDQIPARTFETTEKNIEMPATSGQKEFRDVEYRQYDFDSSNSSLQNYFDRLDTKIPNHADQSQEPVFQTLSAHEDCSLIKYEQKTFIVDTPKLMSIWLKDLLGKGDKTPMPLLVSQPLRLEKVISDNFMSELSEVGFEIDKIGQTDYVLRTFPQCLKNFPFKEYLEGFFNHGVSEKSLSSFYTYQVHDQKLWDRHHKKALEALSITELSKESVLVELTREKLKKLL
ncbi:MAG: DNA mismatch repair endonuclease MutL [Bacteriovoracaceae bacterium]|nr:DNA mismatch repair endonuclease MutL [Bacteriovoracaceae bacterium]